MIEIITFVETESQCFKKNYLGFLIIARLNYYILNQADTANASK